MATDTDTGAIHESIDIGLPTLSKEVYTDKDLLNSYPEAWYIYRFAEMPKFPTPAYVVI